ncbi:MAG: hypothetical protein ACE5FG_05385 [Myxococcota bacterium]
MYLKSTRRPSTRRTRVALVAALIVSLAACRPDSEGPPVGGSSAPGEIPALGFAGVDLVYALRRVAAEAQVLLALDEVDAGPLVPDLARYRVDVDLPAGPVSRALDTLREATGAFDYRIHGNVLYVRSVLAVDAVTALDVGGLAATHLNVDFVELVRWIMHVRPGSFLNANKTRGEPVYRKVELEVAEGSAILDLLIQYAAKVERGWRMKRAGQRVTDAQGRPGIVASSLSLWSALKQPDPLPRYRMNTSTLGALASIQDRTGTAICIKDRSVTGTIQPSLDYRKKLDPGLDFEESLRLLAKPPPTSSLADFSWERRDRVVLLTSQFYEYYLPGRDLLRSELQGGAFEGTLAELARWLNESRKGSVRKVLMGGEILRDAPRARIEVPEGASVEEALLAFAHASGDGWVIVIVDAFTPEASAQKIPPGDWRGAYLTRLQPWMAEIRPPGVADEPERPPTGAAPPAGG